VQKDTPKNEFLRLNKRDFRSMVEREIIEFQSMCPLSFYHTTILHSYSVNVNLYLSPKIFQYLFSLYLGSYVGRYRHEIKKMNICLHTTASN
jgi:hypothetical protein